MLHVDRFGNAITNIGREALDGREGARVEAAGRSLPLARTYTDAARGEALALAGSAGWLEIAVREGSAAASLGLRRGSPVAVTGGRRAV